MKKVQVESEQHYHDNFEHFKPKTAAGERGKIDFATNSIDAPKKKKKEGLDAHAASQIQQIVIKRFKTVKKDIMYEDDARMAKVLIKQLREMREDQNGESSVRQDSKPNANSNRGPSG